MLSPHSLCPMVSLSLEAKTKRFECGMEGNSKKNSKDMMILSANLLKFLLFKALHRVQMTKLLNFGQWTVRFSRKTRVIRPLSSILTAFLQVRLFLRVMTAASSFGKMELAAKLSRCPTQFGV